jgi:hypothetical protein
MTLDQQITHAAAKAAVARSNGDEAGEAYWWNETIRLSDQRECAWIHSDAFTERVLASISRLEARDVQRP